MHPTTKSLLNHHPLAGVLVKKGFKGKQGFDNYSFKAKIDDYSILRFYSIPLILKNTNMINLHFLENEKFSCHSKIPLETAFYQSDTGIVFLSFFFRLLLLIYQRSGFPGGQYCEDVSGRL